MDVLLVSSSGTTVAGALRSPSNCGRRHALIVTSKMMWPSPNAMEEDPKAVEGDPYVWDTTILVPRPVLLLWEEVAKGIDKSQTGE